MVCVSHPGYSWAITEATVQVNVEWVEGKEEFPGPLLKNFPCPSVRVGRYRSKTSFSPSSTTTAFTSASPESSPVSRNFGNALRLPQEYMKTGSAAIPIRPPLAILSLEVTAFALERSLCML